MDRVDAVGLGHRQEDRRADQDLRRQVHEHAQQQQHHHDHQQHGVLAVGDGLQEAHRRRRHLQVGQQPAEHRRGGDHEQDHPGGARGMRHRTEELGPAQLPVQQRGDQQRVHHRDRRALHRGEDAGADADEDQRDQSQARQRADQTQRHRAPARERLGAVAARARHRVAGEHHRRGHQQRRDDAGGEQVGDRQAATGRGREQDQVVRGRHQKRDQRRGHADVDRVVAVVAAVDHLRNHRAADRRDVGDGRAGHAAEEQRGQHADLAQAATHAPDQRGRQRDQAVGDATAQHQFAGEDEQRDRDQRRRAAAGGDLLHQHHRRQVQIQQRGQRGRAQRIRHRHADQQQHHEQSQQDGDGHAQFLPMVAPGRSTRQAWYSANTLISAPPIDSGR
ncbi:hypothetical protein NB706_002723 [Xanthomonas sacchari]|nr:hypothetical protein [Xanthomonas sacchari]